MPRRATFDPTQAGLALWTASLGIVACGGVTLDGGNVGGDDAGRGAPSSDAGGDGTGARTDGAMANDALSSSCASDVCAAGRTADAGGDSPSARPGDGVVVLWSDESGWTQPSSMAIDATDIYLTADSGDNGVVVRVPKSGGAPTTLASTGEDPFGIALDATHVYWRAANDVEGWDILSVPKGGGTPTTITSQPEIQWGPVVNDTDLYWAWSSAGVYPGTNTFAVVTVPKSGGTPSTIASGTDQVMDLTVDATNVYWIEQDHAAVMALPVAGGVPTKLAATTDASADAYGLSLAIHGANVYWTDSHSERVPKVGGATVEVYHSPSIGPFTVDSANFFLVNCVRGELLTGLQGAAHAVVTRPTSPDGGIWYVADPVVGLAVDDTSIFWLDGNNGGPLLFKRPK